MTLSEESIILMTLTGFLITVIDPSPTLRMTSYRLECDGNGFFAGLPDDVLT